jgi:hypothetical protein
MSIRRIVLGTALLMIAGAVLAPLAAASPPPGPECYGALVSTGCWFCSQDENNNQVPDVNCRLDEPGYHWEYCKLWVLGACELS